MKKIIERVKNGEILVSDGAWGTMLQTRGLKPGECPELWCLDHRNYVMDIPRQYIAAGADMTLTNSFGGSRFKLDFFGLADKAVEINTAAAAISREAAGPDRHVLGSIGPTGKMLLMGDVTEDALYDAFKEQAMALEKGGADAACIETMSALDEACLAVQAVKQNTNLEIICTFTFEQTVDKTYRTMMGVSPSDVIQPCIEAGADILGANCGNGFERMIDIIREMRALNADIPLLVHANAGMPKNINGKDVFPDTPEFMAGLAPTLADAGANIIGGCCGTTPEHIKAISEALKKR